MHSLTSCHTTGSLGSYRYCVSASHHEPPTRQTISNTHIYIPGASKNGGRHLEACNTHTKNSMLPRGCDPRKLQLCTIPSRSQQLDTAVECDRHGHAHANNNYRSTHSSLAHLHLNCTAMHAVGGAFAAAAAAAASLLSSNCWPAHRHPTQAC